MTSTGLLNQVPIEKFVEHFQEQTICVIVVGWGAIFAFVLALCFSSDAYKAGFGALTFICLGMMLLFIYLSLKNGDYRQ